ncbi:Peptidoglycan glycosyltransferase MrdB [bacterium HR33]|nr:Peptidoglycan glycosyltransferase MrdB [bacterium HR33]
MLRPQTLASWLLAVAGGLLAAGLITLYSAGQTDTPTVASGLWLRQLWWLAIGLVLARVAFKTPPRVLEWLAPAFYGGALLLLVMTLLFGSGGGTAAGARSWLAIGGFRLGQPAEVAKLATIILLARYLGSRRRAPQTLAELIPPCLITAAPALLVALQPDLGSAVVFVGILFAVLFWVGTPGRLLFLLASPLFSLLLAFSTVSWGVWIVVLTALLIWARPYAFEGVMVWLVNVIMGVVALDLWERLAPYQQNRLLSFLNPEIDPQATGWNIIQSKVAIGSGGLLGKGFLEGTQKRLAFLPAQHTDFIFSVLAEEWGFLGVVAVIGLFVALFSVLIQIARNARDPFSSVLVFGVAGLLFTHVVENIGMTVGLMPITGIPLPLFSYGGSFLVVCLVSLGLVLRVAWDVKFAGFREP